MKTSRLASPANPCGALHPRVLTTAISACFLRLRALNIARTIFPFVLLLSHVASATVVSWNPNAESDIARYEVRYGTASGNHTVTVDAGLNTRASIAGLTKGATYYFVVRAINQSGLISSPSAEVAYLVPLDPPVNQTPVATGRSVTTLEDTALPISLVATDGDNDTLTYTVVTGPTKGILTGSGASLTYTPNPDVNGTDSFTFRANDGKVDSNIATVSIAISAVNDAPIAANRNVSTNEDTAVAVVLSATDKENNTLTYSIVSNPTKGTLTGSGANRTYTPNADVNGTDSFTYKANDGLDSNIATVTITINAVNDAPVAANRSVSTNEDTAVAVVLSATDKENNALTYTIVSGPGKGTLTGSGANRTYTPNADVNGTDTFTYKANDGLDSNIATVTITINAVNDAPVAANRSVTTNEDTAAAVVLSATDKENNALTYTIVSGPGKGTLTGSGANRTYTPNADVNGTDSFTYKANDGLDSNIATVTITINAVNDAPVAANRSVSTNEDTAVAVVLSATDKENNTLNYSIVSNPTKGTLSGSGANRTYTPNADVNGTDSFTYKANDGLDSNIATVTITINAVNDAPVATNRSVSTNEDTAVAVVLSATDKENNTLTYSIVSNPGKGTLTGSGANRTYTPSADVNGTDTFTYKANDGLDSNIATVTITINAINDIPLAHSGRFVTPSATAVSMRISGSDKEGSTLTYQILTPPSNGQLTGSAPDFTYIPDSEFAGTDTFTFTVNDGSSASAPATITIDVQQPDTSGETGLLAQSGWTLLGFDTEDAEDHPAIHAFDGDPDTFWHTRWTSNPTPPPHHISIDLGDVCLIDGFRYLPRQDPFSAGNIGNYQFHTSMDGIDWGLPVAEGTFESGPDEKEVRFLATRARYIRLTALSEADSGMHTNAAEISVIGTVTTNQAPTVETILASTSINTSVPIILDGQDPDGDIISYSIVSGPSNGTLAGTAPDLSYVPSPGFSGTDSFIYQASDGVLESTTAVVTIEVTRPNSPPVADSRTITTSANSAVSILLTASDEEDDALNYTLVTGPSNGRLSGSAPALAYLPDSGFSGVDSFTFRVADAGGFSQTATITLIVKPGPATIPNKAPVFHTRPVTRTAGMEGKPYKAASLANAAQDADSDDALTFTKISGPSWLKIAANGSLSGTPPEDSAGKHQFVIRAFDSENAYAESALLIDIAPAGLPLPWEFDTIGKNNRDAKTSWEGGTFSLRSAGGLNGGADSAGFVWQRLSGDGQIIARVVDVVNGGNTARAGVMIRESLAPNSRHVFMGITGSGSYRAIRRDRTAKAALVKVTGNGKPSNAWVRLVRKGDTITSYKSSNGEDWVKTHVATIKLNSRCYVGLATTSGRSTACSAIFRDVKVNP